MYSGSHITRFAIFCLLLFPLVSVGAQEISPNDIDPNTEDIRCVEKDYRHKTVVELEQMTPEQLIDEDARHWNYHVSLMDRYGMFTLASFTEKIGTAIIPILNKLATDFRTRPESVCQQERFFKAFAIAADADNQIVRLRTREDGRAAIAAAADALRAMNDAGLANPDVYPYNNYAFGKSMLSYLNGFNEHDEQMREMLKTEYRLKLSDKEFVDFVKFLSSTYPTYPSWTPRIDMARDFQKNKKKYHDAYLAFRKSRPSVRKS